MRPYSDRGKAEAFYREFQETEYYEGNVPVRIFLAELLRTRCGEAPREGARRLLREAMERDAHPYWHDEAQKLLDDL